MGHESAKIRHDSAKMGILSSTWELLGQFWEHFSRILKLLAGILRILAGKRIKKPIRFRKFFPLLGGSEEVSEASWRLSWTISEHFRT